MPTLHRAQSVDKSQAFLASVNAAFKLRVADLLQKLGELRAGREALIDERGAVEKRRRIKPLGRPGQPLVAECQRRIGAARHGFVQVQEFVGTFVNEHSLQARPGKHWSLLDNCQLSQQPVGAIDFFVGVAQAAADLGGKPGAEGGEPTRFAGAPAGSGE